MLDAPRFDLNDLPPDAYRGMLGVERLIEAELDPTLYFLIRLRASQINGCAFCLAMHTEGALKIGISPERMTALAAWHESPLFTDRERVALAWTDELTLIAESHASQEAFEALQAHFSDEEIRWLILAIVQINGWNRMAIATRAQYDPKVAVQPEARTAEPAMA